MNLVFAESSWKVNNTSELPEVAKSLIEFGGSRRVFVFYGEMGAGKTTFIKEICKTLGVDDLVSSPTFTIVNEYSTKEGQPVYHFDFYRIKTPAEAFDFGYENYFYSGNYCFIEWPEMISGLLPEQPVRITITNHEGVRQIKATI